MPPISRRVSMAAQTTLQVGGPAEYFSSVTTTAELAAVVSWAKAQQQPVTILGGGSNVLVADTGLSGVVVQITGGEWHYEPVATGQVRVRADAGVNFDTLVADTVAHGYWGLENLSHIPGTVGATPVQNVGAYGVEVADVIESVTVFDVVTEIVEEWPASACAFEYRHSYFKLATRGRYVVMAVTLLLETQPRPQLEYGALQELALRPQLTAAEIRDAVIAIRASKFPDWRRVGTAGSFFMNPSIPKSHACTLKSRYPDLPIYPNGGTTKVSLGWLLDHVCDLRGYREGSIGLHDKQALVLVQYGGASAAAIDTFARHVAAVVYERTGITVTREVTSLPYPP